MGDEVPGAAHDADTGNRNDEFSDGTHNRADRANREVESDAHAREEGRGDESEMAAAARGVHVG